MAYQALRRSIKRKDRLSALINAYFLGKVLNDVKGPRQEYQLKKELTSHYITMAENAYILFEFDPTQLLRTVELDIRDLRQTKRKDIVNIANTTMNILVSTRNLKGRAVRVWHSRPYCAAGIDKLYFVLFVYLVYFV